MRRCELLQRTYADEVKYHPGGQLLREKFGAQMPLYLNLHYNSRLQMVDLRLGTSSTDEWHWNRGALIFYYGTNAVNQWNPFADDADNNGNVRRALHYVPKDEAISAYAVTMLQDYSYDALNRIGSVSESYQDESGVWTLNYLSQSFGYDRYGNRQITAATGGANGYNPSYDQTTNRIVGLGYDGAGNTTSDPLTGGTMTYDAENRLLTATSGGGGSYTYDGEGRRVKRVTAGQEWWYVYGMGGELLAEYLASAPATVKKEYGYRDGQLLVVWDGDEVGDKQLKWLVQDHLGSTRMETDRSGSLTGMKRHDYLPFGEELYAGIRQSGGQGQYGYEPPASNVRQRFGSKERDTETSLDYFLARYYSSVQGRFTSVDPENAGSFLNDPQSWHGYAYARNNPSTYGDPSGTTYKLCTSEGCSYHSDDNVDEWRKAEGVNFKSGKIYNKDGKQIGTYERTYFDHETPQFNQFVFGMAARGTATKQAIALFAGGGALIGTGIGGAMYLGGVTVGGGITTLGLSGGGGAATDAAFIGLTAEEIAAINSEFGGTTTLSGHVDTVIANMSYREAFWDKAATVVRDIAGRHLFNDANKRTAQKVVEELMRRNGVTGPSPMHIRAVIDKVATGALRTVEEISSALSGSH